MGAALPNGNDIEVINQLNKQFTGANFDAIRKYVAGGDDFLWGNNKSLARAAYRLNIWPTVGTKPRKRWFAFLGRILSRNNRDDIKDALKKAVQNNTNNVIGVHFWAQYDPNVAPNSYVVVVTDEPADAAGHIFRKITLLTDHEIPANEGGDPNPGSDPDETGPVHPIRHKKSKSKKRAKKAKKKKTAKKKATKKAKKSNRK
jgi:hypothetical protein